MNTWAADGCGTEEDHSDVMGFADDEADKNTRVEEKHGMRLKLAGGKLER